LVERPQQASGGIGSEEQLDLRDSENESDKFDSGERYVDSFVAGLDSVAVGVNRVAVKSNVSPMPSLKPQLFVVLEKIVGNQSKTLDTQCELDFTFLHLVFRKLNSLHT
jgi:hypothetical protein